MWKDEAHQREYRCLQDAMTNQQVWLSFVGAKNHVADGLTQTLSQQVLKNMLTTLKTELTEPQHENVSISMVHGKKS